MQDEMLLSAAALSLVQIVRVMPAIVWSLRCRPSSKSYLCPPTFPSRGKQRVMGSGSPDHYAATTALMVSIHDENRQTGDA
jgi:hypothetical protein